jgi:hypothetical protein
MAFEAKLTVMTSGLSSADEANRRNEEIAELLHSLFNDATGDLVVGAEIIEYDPDKE